MTVDIVGSSLSFKEDIYFLTDKGNIFSKYESHISIKEDGSAEETYVLYGGFTVADIDNKEIKVDELGKVIAISNSRFSLEVYFRKRK